MARKILNNTQTEQLVVNPQALNTTCQIVTLGSVPDTQTQDATGFTPDYRLTPLSLCPVCSVSNPFSDEAMPATVNSQLTNIGWYELQYDKTSNSYVRGDKIASGSNGYELPAADEAGGILDGTLTIKKNSSFDNPIRLEFEAQYVDPSSGMTYKFTMQKTIVVRSSKAGEAVLSVDCPTSLDWNPLREKSVLSVTAAVYQGEKRVTLNWTCNWYHVADDGTMTLIKTADDIANIEVQTGVGHSTLVIDRDLIGDGQKYACKAVVGGKETNTAYFAIVRRIPALYCKTYQVSPIVTAGGNISVIRPRCAVNDNVGMLDDPWDVLAASLFIKRKGDSGYTEVDPGNPAPQVEWSDGMEYYFAVYDRGPKALLVEDTAAEEPTYMTDGDTYLLAREND